MVSSALVCLCRLPSLGEGRARRGMMGCVWAYLVCPVEVPFSLPLVKYPSGFAEAVVRWDSWEWTGLRGRGRKMSSPAS